MSNHSVIEHRANYHFARIEEDYIAICLKGEASPHCKALILAILESWTNTKRGNGEEPIVYMTYPQWVQAMYWQHGRNVIIESLEELEKQGLIIRKPYRFKGKDTFAYVLNVQAVQEHIKALPEKADGEYLPRFNLNAFKNKRVPNQTRPKSNDNAVYNQTPEAFNNIRLIDSSPQLQNITSKDVASQNFDATSLSFEKSHIIFEHYAGNETLYYHSACVDGHYGASEGMILTAVSLERAPQDAICGMCQSKIALAPFEVEKPLAPSDFLPDEQLATSYADEQGREMHALAAAYEDEDDRPTQKVPAIKLNGATNGNSTTDRQYPHTPGRSLDRLPVEETPVAIANTLDGTVSPPAAAVRQSYTPSVSDGATTESGGESPPSDSSHSAVSEQASQAILQQQAASRQAQNGAGTRQRKSKKVTQAELKTPEEEAFDARCTALQKRINAWRGYSLEKQGAIINERRCIRKLVEKFTDEQHDLIHQYLFTRHWRYSKPDNRYTIGGYVLLEEGDNVLQILKDEKQKPAPLADKKPLDIYTAASLDPERNKRNLERLKQRTAARLAAEGGVN